MGRRRILDFAVGAVAAFVVSYLQAKVTGDRLSQARSECSTQIDALEVQNRALEDKAGRFVNALAGRASNYSGYSRLCVTDKGVATPALDEGPCPDTAYTIAAVFTDWRKDAVETYHVTDPVKR